MQKLKFLTFAPSSLLSNEGHILQGLLVWHLTPQALLQKPLGFYVWLKHNLPPKTSRGPQEMVGCLLPVLLYSKRNKVFPNRCTGTAESYATAAQTSPPLHARRVLLAMLAVGVTASSRILAPPVCNACALKHLSEGRRCFIQSSANFCFAFIRVTVLTEMHTQLHILGVLIFMMYYVGMVIRQPIFTEFQIGVGYYTLSVSHGGREKIYVCSQTSPISFREDH